MSRKITEAKTCCHICEEPLSNTAMNSTVESRLVLKITSFLFWKKIKTRSSLQKQKSLLTKKEVLQQ